MLEAESFPKDLKEELPLYETPKPAEKPSRKFGVVKKLAATALVLYLGATAYHFAPAIMHSMSRHGEHHAHNRDHSHGRSRGHHSPDAFYLPNQLIRSDITEGQVGIPLLLDVVVLDSETSLPIKNLNVDLWQADAHGKYSGFHHRGPPRHHVEDHDSHPHGPHDEQDGSRHSNKHEGSEDSKDLDEHHDLEEHAEHEDAEHEEKNLKHEKHEKDGKHEKKDKHEKHGKKDKKDKHEKHGKKDKHDKAPKEGKKPHHGPHGPPPHHEPHNPHHGPPPHFPHHGPPKDGRKHGKHNHSFDAFDELDASQWLRGVQQTSDAGKATFKTIFQNKIHYKIHSPSNNLDTEHFEAEGTQELKVGKLFFEEALVSKVRELETYKSPKPWTMKKHHKGDCKKQAAREVVTEVEYLEEGVIESGLRARVTILVDGASKYVADEFTDTDSE